MLRASPARHLLLATVLLLAACGPADPARAAESPPAAAGEGEVELKLDPKPAGARAVYLSPATGGEHRFRVTWRDGGASDLSADEFATLLYRENVDRPWLYLLLNISSPAGVAWVLLGFLGQALFTGRMLVQWLVSERAHRSVVPVAFWWLSLAGATMLLIYFVWRRDVVGVVGQATGWIIYGRNLWLIRREAPAA